jgi:phage shock protein PspC (stress-responsive transcriptional regulator)
MFCMNCGNKVIDEEVNCPTCGQLPLAENKYCYECGKEISSDMNACQNCNAPLTPDFKFPPEEKIPVFYRSSDEGVINGFCAGLAHKFNTSPIPIRILSIFFMPFPLYFLASLLPAIPTRNALLKFKLKLK